MPIKLFEKKNPCGRTGTDPGRGVAGGACPMATLGTEWGHWGCTETQEEAAAAIRQRKMAWPEVGVRWSVLVNFKREASRFPDRLPAACERERGISDNSRPPLCQGLPSTEMVGAAMVGVR